MFTHQRATALNDTRYAGFANKHVMRFFGQHEPAGPRQRVETGFGQRRQLILAVAVLEIGEHEERQPIVGLFVESLQNARPVRVSGVAL